ncbi:hypothetical protein ACRAWF_02025 [Streptomyces sp. L7]
MRGDLIHAQLMGGKLLDAAEKQGARAARGAVYWNAGLVARSRGQPQRGPGPGGAGARADVGGRQPAPSRDAQDELRLPAAPGRRASNRRAAAAVGGRRSSFWPRWATHRSSPSARSVSLMPTRCSGQWDEAAAHAERALGLTGTESRIQAVGSAARQPEIQPDARQPRAGRAVSRRPPPGSRASSARRTRWPSTGVTWATCGSGRQHRRSAQRVRPGTVGRRDGTAPRPGPDPPEQHRA